MNNVKKLSFWMAALALVGLGATSAPAVTNHNFNATIAGTWDINGGHSTGRYFEGHSTETPAENLSYFAFDLSSIKGKTATHASITVPGTNDWAFTVPWTGHTPLLQFKQKVQVIDTSRFTVSNILNGMPNPADNWKIYHYEQTFANLSYEWDPDGFTHNYELTPPRFPGTLAKIQAMVNAGGTQVILIMSGFGTTASTEEYKYNGTGVPLTTPVVLTVSTSN